MTGPTQQIYWIAINPVFFLIWINLCNRFIGLKQFQTPMQLGISTPGAPQHPLVSSQGNSCVYTSGTEHRLPSSAEIPLSHKNMAIKSTSYNVGGSLMAQRFLMFQVPCNSSAFLDDLKRDGFEALKLIFFRKAVQSQIEVYLDNKLADFIICKLTVLLPCMLSAHCFAHIRSLVSFF